MNTSQTLTRIGLVVAAGMLSAALIPGAALAADKSTEAPANKPAAEATEAAPDASTKATDDKIAAQAEETRAYGLVFDNEESGVGSIYYASP